MSGFDKGNNGYKANNATKSPNGGKEIAAGSCDCSKTNHQVGPNVTQRNVISTANKGKGGGTVNTQPITPKTGVINTKPDNYRNN